MTEQDCPIRLEVNAACFLMEGMHGVLDLQFVNLTPDESFEVDSHLSSHLFPSPPIKTLTLNSKQSKKCSIQMNLPAKSDKTNGSAGRTLVEIELIIDAGNDGRHRYTGEFQLTILEHTNNRHEVNVNIGNIIEQHGDKTGMGGINEVDLKNMINLPSSLTINQLLEQDRQPRFIEIELEYAGPVEDHHPTIIHRENIDPIDRCALVCDGSNNRTLLLASHTIMLGRSRDKADITTWIMPLNDENHRQTRMISKEQVKLYFDRTAGPSAKLVSHINPSQIDDTPLDRRTPIPLPIVDYFTLLLHKNFALKITPIPMPDIPTDWQDAWLTDADETTHNRWTWARRNNLSGFLIERTDALRNQERYLWLIAAITHPTAQTSINLLQINNQLMMTALVGNQAPTFNGQTIKEGEAMPIHHGDQCMVGNTRIAITHYEQYLPSD